MLWTIQKILDWSVDYFQKKGVDAPRLNAELLLGRALELSRVQLYVQFDRPLSEAELAAYKKLVQRRGNREPLAFILGEKEFFSMTFWVEPCTLIPRPETEELVERGLEFLRTRNPGPTRVLDLATGSGCLLLAILKNFAEAQGIGVDLSAAALALARRNAERHQLGERCSWIEQDLFQTWPESLSGPFDLITANLPYVSAAEWEALAPEIRDHEPKAALTPGPSGLEAFAAVLPQLPSRLQEGGLALLEIGADQAAQLPALAAQYCPGLQAAVHQDSAKRPRILSLSKF